MILLCRYRVDLQERKSVIIFDEVQLCPVARQAIKVLVADHRYDYIETGSLISIKKNVKDILIPSEERKNSNLKHLQKVPLFLLMLLQNLLIYNFRIHF